MFSRLASFHFVQNHADPIGALKSELEKTDASDSLLVLPEAFNLGCHYSEDGPYRFSRDCIIKALQRISKAKNITFVAALLDTPDPAGKAPLSSAYVIDAEEYRLICHKELADQKEGRRYRRCPVDCDIDNPISFKGAAIMAMICMDADSHSRRDALASQLAQKPESTRIICIMGAFTLSGWLYGSMLDETINFTSPRALDTRIIMADAIETGPSSCITNTEWTVVACVPKYKRHCNQIVVSDI